MASRLPRPRLAATRQSEHARDAGAGRVKAEQGHRGWDGAQEDESVELASHAEMEKLGNDVMMWDEPESMTPTRVEDRVHGFQQLDPNTSRSSTRSKRSLRKGSARKSSATKQRSKTTKKGAPGSTSRARRSDRGPNVSKNTFNETSLVENMASSHNTSLRQSSRNSPAEDALAVFQDVVFPPLRTVLWDRTPLGDSCVLGAEAHVPTLRFRRATLASLYNDAAAKTDYFGSLDSRRRREIIALTRGFPMQEDTPTLAGYAGRTLDYGPVGDWVGGAWEATIQSFHATPRARKADEMRIFCAYKRALDEEMAEAHKQVSSGGFQHAFEANTDRSLGEGASFTTDEYTGIIRKAVEKFRTKGPADPVQYLDGYAVCKALPGNRLAMRVEVILPSISLEFTPITPLSILGTPLARQLDQWASAGTKMGTQVDPSDPTACGFVTLNQTRKAVFLLEDDPMAYELPLVGIWLRSAAASDLGRHQTADWQTMLNGPFLWSVCLRYIHNDRIKEKVSPPEAPSTFLVVVYPPGSPLPQFLECSYSMFQDKEALSKVGVEPRPFLQLETAFEVDVSMMGSPQTGQRGDAVDAKFYHVDALSRRRCFQDAFDEIAGRWRNDEEQAAQELRDFHELSSHERQSSPSNQQHHQHHHHRHHRQRHHSRGSDASSRPPSPPHSTPPPPPPSYAPPGVATRDLRQRQQPQQQRGEESTQFGHVSSMYFRPDAGDNGKEGGLAGAGQGAFGGLFDDEEEFGFRGNETINEMDEFLGIERDRRGRDGYEHDDTFDFPGHEPPAQHTMLSTIYGANLTRLNESMAPSFSPLQTSRASETHAGRGGSLRARKNPRTHRGEGPSYMTSSFDTSALGPSNQSMSSSRTRRSKTRSRQYQSMLTAQQQQISLMQQQILGLQKLMEEQIRINSLSRAQTISLAAETEKSDSTSKPESAVSKEENTARVAAPAVEKSNQDLGESATAVYLAGLQQYDEDDEEDDGEDDEDEVEEEGEKSESTAKNKDDGNTSGPTDTNREMSSSEAKEGKAPDSTSEEKHRSGGESRDTRLGPAATAAASASMSARREAASKEEGVLSVQEPPSVASSSGVGSTMLRIPSNSTDSASEPPSIIREDPDAEDPQVSATQSQARPYQGGPMDQASISNIYAEMDTEFGIPQIREVAFSGGSRRRRLDTGHSESSRQSNRGANGVLHAAYEDEEDEDDDDEWLAAVEAKYLKQARESGRT